MQMELCSQLPHQRMNLHSSLVVSYSLSSIHPIECPIFSLSTGQLLLSSLSIYPDTNESPINLTTPLIVVKGDVFSMEGCSISNISLTSGDFEASVLCTYLNST